MKSVTVFFCVVYLVAHGYEVRVIHASPDADTIDVLVNDTLIQGLVGISFTKSSRYLFELPGIYNFKVVPTGETSPVIIEKTLTIVDTFAPYTIVLVGTLKLIAPLVLTDAVDLPHGNTTLVRFVHAVPDAPTMEIGVIDGPILFPNVSFASQNVEYIAVPGGDYDLYIKITGSNNTVLKMPDIRFYPKLIYSIFAEGLLQGEQPTLQAVIYYDI